MGEEFSETIDYFDSCRNKRNAAGYDRAGEISETEAKELLKEAKNFKEIVVSWLKENYPHFL